MTKPRNWYWNPISQKWEQKGRDGLVKAWSNEGGLGATKLKVGDSGSQVSQVLGFTGTNAAITAVGSGAIAVGTITNAMGIAAGDKIFGAMKADRSAGHVGVAGFYVPINNVLNVFLQNSKPDSAGSFPATGWDTVALRSA